MDAVLFLRKTAHFQSVELERAEVICGFESGSRSRLWSAGGNRAGRKVDVVFWAKLGREHYCLSEPIHLGMLLRI
jgi:hypothetical protein